jgi:hypothetical protein
MKKFRKPYISVFLMLLIFSSCTRDVITDDLLERKFDYSIYEAFKTNPINLKDTLLLKDSNVEISKNILNYVNEYYGSNLTLPDEFHEKLISNNDSFQEFLIESNNIDSSKLLRLQKLENDIYHIGFDEALKNYEFVINGLQLNYKDFQAENLFLNSMKQLNDSGFFEVSQAKNGSCAWATIVFAAATASLASCATGFLCALAAVGYISAAQAWMEAYTEPVEIEPQDNEPVDN